MVSSWPQTSQCWTSQRLRPIARFRGSICGKGWLVCRIRAHASAEASGPVPVRRASAEARTHHCRRDRLLVAQTHRSTHRTGQPARIEPARHGDLETHGDVQYVPQGPSRSERKSTRLNSSHVAMSYDVFCLKKKK